MIIEENQVNNMLIKEKELEEFIQEVISEFPDLNTNFKEVDNALFFIDLDNEEYLIKAINKKDRFSKELVRDIVIFSRTKSDEIENYKFITGNFNTPIENFIEENSFCIRMSVSEERTEILKSVSQTLKDIYLEKEKKEIIDAFEKGKNQSQNFQNGIDYYNSIFNK
jgi:hypothetical protein